MRSTTILKSLLLSFILLVAVAALAAPAAGTQPAVNPGSAIRTYLQPDLTFKSVLSSDLLIQPQNTQSAFGRTCRCSCGFPCKTNADCGPGGVCAAGITCCNKDPRGSDPWSEGAALSSRSTPLPELKSKCK
jgi:hypothetical protein